MSRELYRDSCILDNASHQKELEKICTDFFEGVPQSLPFPRLVIVGAQMGSGKSTRSREISGRLEENAQKPLWVDVDQLRRYHPNLQEIAARHPFDTSYMTSPDAKSWSLALIADAKDRRANVLYEAGLRRAEDVIDLARDFRAAGYGVDLHVIAVHGAKSTLGIFDRFEKALVAGEIPRFIPLDHHHNTYQRLPENLRRIEQEAPLDLVTVTRRDGTVLYKNFQTSALRAASDRVIEERQRVWTSEEASIHYSRWGSVGEMIATTKATQNQRPDWYKQQSNVYKIESALLAACYGSEVVLPIKIEHSVTTPFFVFSYDQNRLACKNRDIGSAVVEEDCKTGDRTYHHDMVLL